MARRDEGSGERYGLVRGPSCRETTLAMKRRTRSAISSAAVSSAKRPASRPQRLFLVYHREVGVSESLLAADAPLTPALAGARSDGVSSGCGGGVALVVRSRETGNARFRTAAPAAHFTLDVHRDDAAPLAEVALKVDVT